MEYGFITLLPTLLVLGLAIWSRRTLESVLAGALFAFSIMEGFGFLDAMAEATLATLMTEDVAWLDPDNKHRNEPNKLDKYFKDK